MVRLQRRSRAAARTGSAGRRGDCALRRGDRAAGKADRHGLPAAADEGCFRRLAARRQDRGRQPLRRVDAGSGRQFAGDQLVPVAGARARRRERSGADQRRGRGGPPPPGRSDAGGGAGRPRGRQCAQRRPLGCAEHSRTRPHRAGATGGGCAHRRVLARGPEERIRRKVRRRIRRSYRGDARAPRRSGNGPAGRADAGRNEGARRAVSIRALALEPASAAERGCRSCGDQRHARLPSNHRSRPKMCSVR